MQLNKSDLPSLKEYLIEDLISGNMFSHLSFLIHKPCWYKEFENNVNAKHLGNVEYFVATYPGKDGLFELDFSKDHLEAVLKDLITGKEIGRSRFGGRAKKVYKNQLTLWIIWIEYQKKKVAVITTPLEKVSELGK